MSINFSPLEIGRRALNANQFGITVTGQNIANVNTPGYSRQRAVLSEGNPDRFGNFSIGSGVTVEGIQSFRDQFIESRIQAETGIAGRLTARRDSLAPVEAILQGTENGGLQNALNGFFSAFRDLDANPGSAPLRSIAVQKGVNLANTFQSTRSRLFDLRQGIDSRVRSTVDEVNSLTSKVADLNGQIKFAEATGSNPSGLLDQRTEYVNRLSELTGARTYDNGDGTINITIGEGRAVVSGVTAFTLEAGSTPPLGLSAITINGQPAVFDEGTIRGLQDGLNETTAQIDGLDGLAQAIVDRVNTLHTSGTDQNGNPGVNFFTPGTPVTAATISVDAAVVSNPNLVVASALPQPGQNGTVAGEIASLLTDPNTTVGTRTGSFSSIYGSLISQAGEQVRSAEDGLVTQGVILAQATAQREAVSGVSLDEEAINLIQYQKAFEAAARFLKVADEMTQTILSLAG
ncbi:MAG: flagellar hook-associated protein FlgK [Pyrinomonadaceae bacterium]